MRGKAWLSLCLCALCLTGAAGAEITLNGTVSAREAVAVTANVGGNVEEVLVRAGEWIEAGEAAATVSLSGVYAPADGTVRGIEAEAGDSVGETVLSIAPLSKYTPMTAPQTSTLLSARPSTWNVPAMAAMWP